MQILPHHITLPSIHNVLNLAVMLLFQHRGSPQQYIRLKGKVTACLFQIIMARVGAALINGMPNDSANLTLLTATPTLKTFN